MVREVRCNAERPRTLQSGSSPSGGTPQFLLDDQSQESRWGTCTKDRDTMPMKPMLIEKCVYEGLEALRKNRATHLSGRMNRILDALIPTSKSRGMMGKMIAKTLLARPRSATT
jgi:hypothetical protein